MRRVLFHLKEAAILALWIAGIGIIVCWIISSAQAPKGDDYRCNGPARFCE